jgi:hypothetical protein
VKSRQPRRSLAAAELAALWRKADEEPPIKETKLLEQKALARRASSRDLASTAEMRGKHGDK